MEFPGNVFLISAPTGAGKSSLVKALIERNPFINLSISYTTRTPREGEVDGREYFFISKEQFIDWREQGNMLEWAEVYGNFYGTAKSQVESVISTGQDVLLEIDYQGARQIRKKFPGIIDIFILPPSIDELEKRLLKRGLDSPEVIRKRMLTVSSEIGHADEYSYVIINDSFETALDQLDTLVKAAKLKYASQANKHQALFADLGISYLPK